VIKGLGFYLLFIFSSHAMARTMGQKEKWRGVSDPLILNKTYESRLYMLPLKGSIERSHTIWSGDYWPLNKGIINYRWNAYSYNQISSPSKSDLENMSQAEIAQLSPSEKIDIINHRFDYPLKKSVQENANPLAQDWEGICHGWAMASLHHQEPSPKIIIGPKGIAIPFGSSDIKGLLSYFYAFASKTRDYRQMGSRCDSEVGNQDENCEEDLNAGAFHIILANQIGLENKSFIVDTYRLNQVWNHPVLSFETKILREERPATNAAPGTKRSTLLRTTIQYIGESRNSWYPQNGTRERIVKLQNLDYVLEINSYGEIIGGMWKSKERPDFLWIEDKTQKFSGHFNKLSELLND
jgi:hypothetical protein